MEEELTEAIEKKDKESIRHFLRLLLQQVELKNDAEEKSDKIFSELVNIRTDIKAILEVMNARFEAIDRRFEDMNKRFTMMMWFVGILFTLTTAIIKFL